MADMAPSGCTRSANIPAVWRRPRWPNPDFAALAKAYGCWSETVIRTEDFAPALSRAMAQEGVRLLHLKTDIEVITPATTLSRIAGR